MFYETCEYTETGGVMQLCISDFKTSANYIMSACVQSQVRWISAKNIKFQFVAMISKVLDFDIKTSK